MVGNNNYEHYSALDLEIVCVSTTYKQKYFQINSALFKQIKILLMSTLTVDYHYQLQHISFTLVGDDMGTQCAKPA